MTESRRLWFDCSYLDSDTLVVDGDQVDLFEDGRAVRAEIDGGGYEESWVDSTSYVPESDQTEVTLKDAVLTSGLQRCWVSAIKVSAMPHPESYSDIGEGYVTQSDLDNYSGTDSIDTVGNISNGTWEGTPVSVSKGGTGATEASEARSNLEVPSKHAETIGNGTDTSFVINHGLGSEDVTVSIRYAGGTKEEVGAWWQVVDDSSINVEFSEPPSTDEFRITVIG